MLTRNDELEQWIARLESGVIDDPEEDLIELIQSGPDLFRELLAARSLVARITMEILDVMPLPTYSVDVLAIEPGVDAALEALQKILQLVNEFYSSQLEIDKEVSDVQDRQ